MLMYEAHRAGKLLTGLAQIRRGEPKEAVAEFLGNYQDSVAEKAYGANSKRFVHVDPWKLYGGLGPDWVDRAVKYPLFEFADLRRRLGLRLWVVRGGVRFSNDAVESVWANVMVEGEAEWLAANWESLAEIPKERLELYEEHGSYQPVMSRYLSHWFHLHVDLDTGEGIDNMVTWNATAREREAATSINRECLTRAAGCASLCELMPEATRFRREHDYPSWGWSSGSWGEQGRSCD